MKLRHIFLFLLAASAAIARYISSPFPAGSENPVVALMALNAPVLLWLAHGWYALMPGVVVFIGGTLFSGVWHVWFESAPRKKQGKGGLPPWPIAPSDEKPAIVVGETHHPIEAREVPNPDWLVIPERGLYTGVAIFGAVGSGKTSACMHPFARQLLGWQAWNPERRAAALVLEVKGDFCYDIREILKVAKREEDYMEIGMDGKYQWNPLGAHWLDSYSLAYTVSSLLNQLFGKGKDPFWQQAYTNLVKWIIELYRIFPDRWVTLRDVYRCAIDPELFKQKLDEAKGVVKTQMQGAIVISAKDLDKRRADVGRSALGYIFRRGTPDPVDGRARKVVATGECDLPCRPCGGSHRHGPLKGAVRKRQDVVREGLDAAGSEVENLVCRGDFQFPVSVRHGGRRRHFLSQGTRQRTSCRRRGGRER